MLIGLTPATFVCMSQARV